MGLVVLMVLGFGCILINSCEDDAVLKFVEG